jgi:glycosyltransferase involved in cell wall biosynthesis
MMPGCPDCPVVEGTCFARRTDNSRICGLPEYRALMAEWGGGDPPIPEPASEAPPPEPAGPLTVGWVMPGLALGGAEIQALDLMGATDPARIRWHSVAFGYMDSFCRPMFERMEGLCPVDTGTAAIAKVMAECDVVIRWGLPVDHFPVPDRPRRAKVVLMSHGCGVWTMPVFADPDGADAWVAVSVAGLNPIPPSHRDRAVILPNGIDRRRLVPSPGARPRIRAELGIEPDRHLVGYVGRVSAEKGPRLFLEGAAATELRSPGRFGFVMVGDGRDGPDLRRWADLHAPLVRWAGCQSAIGDWYAALDAVVMTSREEADSLTLLESWSTGVPVISTRVGRLLEPDYHELARLLPDRRQPGDIASALLADANDPEGTRTRTVAARAMARERHSADAMACRWTAFLEELARGRVVRPCPCGSA